MIVVDPLHMASPINHDHRFGAPAGGRAYHVRHTGLACPASSAQPGPGDPRPLVAESASGRQPLEVAWQFADSPHSRSVNQDHETDGLSAPAGSAAGRAVAAVACR